MTNKQRNNALVAILAVAVLGTFYLFAGIRADLVKATKEGVKEAVAERLDAYESRLKDSVVAELSKGLVGKIRAGADWVMRRGDDEEEE